MTDFTLAVPIGIAALALALGAVAPPIAGSESIGITTNVRNIASIASPPDAPQRARLKLPVYLHDVLSTGAKSAIGVRLADDTLFSLGANARVEMDEFVYDRGRKASRMSLNFVKGAFRFVSGKATHAYRGQNAIRTPVGTIGIRGTVVTGVIGPEALAYFRQTNPGTEQSVEDPETATLIILSDPGDGEGGDGKEGGIDITAADGKVTGLRTAGDALYFPRRGALPLPPVRLDPQLRRSIERRAQPPGFERNLRPGQAPNARAQSRQNNATGANNVGPNNRNPGAAGRNGSRGSGGFPAGQPAGQGPRPGGGPPR